MGDVLEYSDFAHILSVYGPIRTGGDGGRFGTAPTRQSWINKKLVIGDVFQYSVFALYVC
jgi:hypothetical protein